MIPTNNVITTVAVQGARRKFLTPLAEPDEYLLVLDNTGYQHIPKCPRSAYHYLVRGREQAIKSNALVFGGAVHAGLEAFYKGAEVSAQNDAIVKYFADHVAPLDDHRTPANALAILNHYREEEVGKPLWPLRLDDKPVVEKSFELAMGVIDVDAEIQFVWEPNQPKRYVKRIHVAWSGRIDMIAKRQDGSLIAVDHKTTSIWDSGVTDTYWLADQTRGYIWACQQLWPDLAFNEFLVNFIIFRKPIKNAPASLMSAGPRGGTPQLSFQRLSYKYSPELIAEWHKNVMTIIADFIHMATNNFFPQYTASCTAKFGSCQYHPVCRMGNTALREAALASDGLYRNVTWNPVH